MGDFLDKFNELYKKGYIEVVCTQSRIQSNYTVYYNDGWIELTRSSEWFIPDWRQIPPETQGDYQQRYFNHMIYSFMMHLEKAAIAYYFNKRQEADGVGHFVVDIDKAALKKAVEGQ